MEAENDKKLELASNYNNGVKISKKRKMKMQKVIEDDTLTAQEKETLLSKYDIEGGSD